MRNLRLKLVLLLAPLFLVTLCVNANAQDAHIANPAAIHNAVAAKAANDQANRDVILRVLQRDDVRVVAEKMGLRPEKAEAAVATLTPEEATRLAVPARESEAAFAGGRDVIVISTVTLLLLLILLVLILK